MAKSILVVGRIQKRNGKKVSATARSTDWKGPFIPWGNPIPREVVEADYEEPEEFDPANDYSDEDADAMADREADRWERSLWKD